MDGVIGDKDYIGMSADSSISYDMGVLHAGEKKKMELFVLIQENNEKSTLHEIENTIDVDEKNNVLELKKDSNGGSFAPLTDADIKARELFVAAKKMPQTNQGDTDALNLLK